MYCSKCGAQLDDESAFCPNCGTPCTSEKPAASLPPVVKTEEKIAPEPPVPKGPVTSEGPAANSYYAGEFAKIAAGQKSKFNWAAFFLGPFHQLYHGSVHLFRRTFLPCLIASVVLLAAGQIGSVITMSAFSIGALIMTFVISLLLVAVSVWSLMLAISNGRTYNRKLYDQVQGHAENIPVRVKLALLLLGAYIGVAILAGVLSVAVGGKIVENAWTQELQSANISLSEELEQDSATVDSDIVSASTVHGSDSTPGSGDAERPPLDWDALLSVPVEQAAFYTGGYPVGLCSDGFDNVYLYGDESVRLGEVLAHTFDTYEWRFPEEQGQGTTCLFVGSRSGQTLTISFTTKMLQDDIGIDYGTLEYEDGTNCSFGITESSCILYGLYQAYHSDTRTQAWSQAQQLTGEWINDDASVELEITPVTYGGNDYSINRILDGMIALDITRSNGNVDLRWAQVDDNELYIYERGDGGPGLWVQGNLVDHFTRVE